MPSKKAGKSMCRGKSVKNPNRCKKVSGCKVASGPKRTFCRKSRNRTARRPPRSRSTTPKKVSRGKWAGYNKRQVAELKRLGHSSPPRGHHHIPKSMKKMAARRYW